jgi:hypothetical protein
LRQTLFISHATPEDNAFAIWLASRLIALGYQPWLDRNALLGGEKTWEEIDRVIRHQAAKLLLVYSKRICRNEAPGCLKDGISKELSLGESISKQGGLNDFTILLNLDNSSYNLFIGADRLHQIHFDDNWAEGLRQLTRKLQRDAVPRQEMVEAPEFARWYENDYIIKSGIIPKKELFYTSLWQIPSLPERFFLFQYSSEQAARRVFDGFSMFPVGKISNVLSSFSDLTKAGLEEKGLLISPELPKKFEIRTRDILIESIDRDRHEQREAQNHLKTYLARVFQLLAEGRRLGSYEMASKRPAYYHTKLSLPRRRVTFVYANRNEKRTKALYGEYRGHGYWHYAISCRPIIEPFLAFNLKPHIIFTEDGFSDWPDKATMHRNRRAKGRMWFNKEWRDLQLAFIQSLKKDGLIRIALNESVSITMKKLPFYIRSDFGYTDPQKLTYEDQYSFEEYDEKA